MPEYHCHSSFQTKCRLSCHNIRNDTASQMMACKTLTKFHGFSLILNQRFSDLPVTSFCTDNFFRHCVLQIHQLSPHKCFLLTETIVKLVCGQVYMYLIVPQWILFLYFPVFSITAFDTYPQKLSVQYPHSLSIPGILLPYKVFRWCSAFGLIYPLILNNA